jgi:hypothetical protein
MSPALASLILLSGPSPLRADPAEIQRLVAQLGSPKFAQREAASRRLEAIGPAALDALRQATESDDTEVRRRAEELLAHVDNLRLALREGDYQRLAGRWQAVGRDCQITFEERRVGIILAIREGRRSMFTPFRLTAVGIDLCWGSNREWQGIYAFKEDELLLCLNMANGGARPTNFRDDDDGQVLTLRLRRVPPGPAAK